MREEWRDIPGFEGYYSVSNKGNVFSIRNGALLKQKNRSGYKSVTLSTCGKRNYMFVHRLVALAFIENPDKKPTVNHINEIKDDNRVENLEWATTLEQNTHGTRLARAREHTDYKARKIDYSIVASKHNYQAFGEMLSKPVCALDTQGEFVASFKSLKEASAKTKTNEGHLCECLKGRRKSAGGYVWRYAD